MGALSHLRTVMLQATWPKSFLLAKLRRRPPRGSTTGRQENLALNRTLTSATTPRTTNDIPALREIISALSFALDLTEGAVSGHALRSCLLALRLADALDLPAVEQADLYYAALLKDVGCSSNSARMCQIFGADDRAMKCDTKLEDWTRPGLHMLPFLWKNVLPGQSPFRRAERIFRIATAKHNHNQELIDLRCDRAAKIVRKIGFGDYVAVAVRHLDEHWDGTGYPHGLKAHGIPILSRIMATAQHLDAFCMSKGPSAAIKVLVERTGAWFDPQITQAALGLNRSGTLWTQCLPGHPLADQHQAVLDLEPGRRPKLTAHDVDNICEAFADVVDAKSPFTFRHSIGVKNAAIAIGTTMRLTHDRLQMLRRAALLHDIGKLSVPNSILDGNGKLTDEQFEIIKRHPGLSRQILARISAFREIATVTGEHHEKLDRSGYPDHLGQEDLSLESRILTVADIYAALSEDRPYRAGLDLPTITGIMEKEIPAKLDPRCYEALRASLDASGSLVEPSTQPGSLIPADATALSLTLACS